MHCLYGTYGSSYSSETGLGRLLRIFLLLGSPIVSTAFLVVSLVLWLNCMTLWHLFQRPFHASPDSDIPKNVPCTLAINNQNPWSANCGGTHPKLREIAMRDLAQPVGAGAEERNWSTYIFILDKRRNRFFVDRARKLVMCTSMSG